MKLVSRPAVQKRYPIPLLFVHGLCCGSWIWEWNYLPYFSGLGYDTYAVNLTGHHLNKVPPNLGSLGTRDFLGDLEQAIAQIPTPIVIGHSAGGFLVQKHLEGNHLKGAVLFASVGPRGLEKEVLARRALQNLAKVLSGPHTATSLSFTPSSQMVRQMLFAPASQIPEQDIQKIASLLCAESYRWMTELVFGLVRCDPSRNVSTPILVVAPQEDYFISPRLYEAMAQEYRADIHRIERTGHAVQLELTWRQTAEGIHRWIQERLLLKE